MNRDAETITYRGHSITTYRDRQGRWCVGLMFNDHHLATSGPGHILALTKDRAGAEALGRKHVDETVGVWQKIRDEYDRRIEAAGVAA